MEFSKTQFQNMKLQRSQLSNYRTNNNKTVQWRGKQRGTMILVEVSRARYPFAEKWTEVERLEQRFDIVATFASRIKDLAEFARGSDSCVTQANGRPRSARFHYYFRCHLLLERACTSIVSRFYGREKSLSSTPLPTFGRDKRGFAIYSPSRDRSLAIPRPRCWSTWWLLNDGRQLIVSQVCLENWRLETLGNF